MIHASYRGLATLEESRSHSHTPVREICSDGVDDLRDFLVGELPDGQATIRCKDIPEKLNPLSRVHARHRRSQTDGFAMPLAKRKVVTFG